VRAKRVGTVAVIAATMVLSGTSAGATRTPPTPLVRVANAIVLGSPAGAVGAVVPITLDAPAKTAVTVHYLTTSFDGETNEALPNLDYTPTSGSAVFAPGQVQHDVRVQIRRRPVTEPYKVFHVVLDQVTGANSLRSTGLVRIDYPQTTDLLNGSKALFDSEAAGRGKDYTATVTFALGSKLDHAVTATYSEDSETALAGVDYVAKSGTLAIPAGKVSASVRIRLLRPANGTLEHIEVRLEPLAGAGDQTVASGFIEILPTNV
jgi:hypothetical protein